VRRGRKGWIKNPASFHLVGFLYHHRENIWMNTCLLFVAGKGEFDWLNTPVSPWIYYFYSVRIT
jgi:hypothetical protein